MITIYKISSPDSSKNYIGSTADLRHRIAVHKQYDKDYCKAPCISRIIFEEYGFENCVFEILEECEEDNRNEREQYCIDNTENVINVKNTIFNRSIHQKMKYERIKDNELFKEKNRTRYKDYYEQNKQKISERRKLKYALKRV